MRNRNKINQLGRTASHRSALMMNLANALIQHKRISTTLAKAKALRGYVEPLITKSKNDTTHSRRLVFRHLQNKEAVAELFREVAPKVGERPGGYTRIIKTGFRAGDSAEMCMIELVDFNEVYTTEKKAGAAKKTRRSRRGGSSTTKTGAAPKAAAPEVKEEASAESAEEVKEEAAAAETAEATTEVQAEEVVEETAEAPATETETEETPEEKAEDAGSEEEDTKKDKE